MAIGLLPIKNITFILSHNYHVFLGVRTFKICSLGNFQVPSSILLSTITTQYVRTYSSSNWELVLFDQNLLCPPPLQATAHLLCKVSWCLFPPIGS